MALKFLEMQIEERGEVKLFRDVSSIEKEKAKKRKKSKARNFAVVRM